MKPSLQKILTQFKGVIFDLDGTLVDSMWMWRAIDVEYLARFGYELPDDYQKILSTSRSRNISFAIVLQSTNGARNLVSP